MSDKIVLTRNQLAKFLPTPEAVKAFENLFLQATQLTPSDVNTINANVQVATISADTALGIANYGLSVLQNLSTIVESLEIQPPEVPTIIEDDICITQNININNCDCLEIIKEPDWNFIKNHPTTISGYGITDAYSAVVADAPLTGSGTSGSHLSIPAASAIQNGYLSSTDWGTFNGKQASYTNLTSIGSLANGTGWLYNNGSGTFSYSTPSKSDIGLSNVTNNAQVTSVTGTSPINSSGGTTPAISIDKSDSTHNGYLSSTDWSTFNNKQSALTIGNLTETTSSVLTITGGTGAIIGSGLTVQVKQASHILSGYLSSTDWNTFNGKQASYTNLTSIGGLADSSGWLYNNGSGTFSYSTPTASDVGLGSVTNNTQVKAITSTENKLVKFSDTSSTITNSVIYDDGTSVGISVTPSAWNGSASGCIQLPNYSNIFTYGGTFANSQNAIYSTQGWKYQNATPSKATLHIQQGGGYYWFIGPSGTGGNTLTLTTAMTLDASGDLTVPHTYSNTTANAANMYVHSDGKYYRSTSARKYKTNIEDIESKYVVNFLNNARPIYYKSLSESDNANWGWWGFIAEEVADFDKRLVHWRYNTKEVEKEKVIPAVEKDVENGIEAKEETIEKYTEIVDDLDKPMVAEGVQYERITVLLTKIVQDQQKLIESLTARIEALEAKIDKTI